MTATRFKRCQQLDADTLVHSLRSEFQRIQNRVANPSSSLVADALSSALALFALKDPSLLAFQSRRHDANMKNLFLIDHVPCDTYMRTLLDEVNPLELAPSFCQILAHVQRSNWLEPYRFIDNSYLLLLDGVEYHRSQNVHCPKCLECHHKNGKISYYHQLVGAVLAHPDLAEVLPLMPEPIQPQDGATKGDCERTACKRLLQRITMEHPDLRFIITEDGLSSNGPHIELIKQLKHHFILVVKPADHVELFRQVEVRWQADPQAFRCECDPKTGTLYLYRWANQVALNKAHPQLLVNFLEYWEIASDGQVLYTNSWVTDFYCIVESVVAIGRGGRARWKVENETFNTLKNQGYHFEHNYGHGEKHLAVLLAMIMMLAFLVDQIQQLGNDLFRAAWQKCGTKRQLWEELRVAFRALLLTSLWELYEAVYYGYAKRRPVRIVDP